MRAWLLGLALAGALTSPALADSNLERLQALQLAVRVGPVAVHYSASARTEAAIYADELDRAVRWFKSQLPAWQGDVVMAVLNRDDWPKVTPDIPYPTPHAERATGLVILADRLESHPGFDQWDLDPMLANASLTFHEVGHVIARNLGISSGNHWVNEFVANVFLAGYVRGADPKYARVLAAPPRFTKFGRFTALTDFDDIHYAMGALNYAWFQFKLMELADFLVTGSDFAAVVAGLRTAFPAARENQRLTLADTLAQIEAIRPGFTARAAPLLGESGLPSIAAAGCGAEGRPGDAIPLVVENRTGAPLALNNRKRAETLIGIAMRRGKLPAGSDRKRLVEEALATDTYAEVIEPGQRLVTQIGAGTEWHIVGADCFVMPAEPARFVWTGG